MTFSVTAPHAHAQMPSESQMITCLVRGRITFAGATFKERLIFKVIGKEELICLYPETKAFKVCGARVW